MTARKRIPAWAAVAALALTGLTAAPAHATPPTSAAITTHDLTDTSADQQRWLSVPNSRVVLNPYNFDNSGSELAQNSGKEMPLSNGYYAWDKAIRTSDVLSTYVGSATEPPEVAFEDTFDNLTNWSAIEVSTSVSGGAVTVTTNGTAVNNSWGSIMSKALTVDLGRYSKITVTVPSTSPAGVGKWALKVNMTGGGDDINAKLQEDTTSTGTFTYDLGKFMAEQGLTGVQTFHLRLWTSNWNTGAGQVSATFDNIKISQQAAGSFPDAGQLIQEADEFDSNGTWANNSATLTTANSLGKVTLPGSTHGYVSKQFSNVNLTKTAMLSVKVPASTGKWAIKVNDGSGDTTLQGDVAATGTFSYNIANLTGWSGTKTFTVKVFQIGDGASGTSTSFDRLSIHSGSDGTALATANSVDYSWTPAALTMAGTYSSGTVTSNEFFTANDRDAYTRLLTSTLTEDLIVAGAAESTPTYDAGQHVITVPGEWATRSISVPAAGEVKFYSSKSAFLSGNGATTAPTSATRFWSVTLPGTGTYAIGVGWAVNAAQNNPGTALTAAATSATAAAVPATATTNQQHWVSAWDDYLAKTPVVQDFSIQRVATGGVTGAQMEHFYYKAWIGLEMNVLPATPETGNHYAQLGTGKPSMWMNGTPGTRNVASWDSLLGMQQLVYTDPANAWASYEGMMALVEDSPSATVPSDTAYGTLGELGGESLPSRKAQTAWILYQATGDQQKLESIYDKLKLHLNWERYNMRWVLGSHNYLDERDSEFVTSLIYDLKYAIKIAQQLGNTTDMALWSSWIPELTNDYEQWFFPTTQDAAGKTWSTVQKVYLDTTRSTSPSADDGESTPYRNSSGAWVDPGWSFYTSTAFVIDGLDATSKAKVRARFDADFDETKQLAGLGSFAIKAPDAQLITYGLLDQGTATSADDATVLVNSLNRDMVKSGWFAEVYYANGNIGDTVGSRGVRPSLFGISNYLDNIFIANGVRIDDGNPSIVRLDGATGGVSGLTYLGKSLNVDLDGTQAKLSGDAVTLGTLPTTVDVSEVGKTVQPPASAVSNDASLASISVDGVPVSGFTSTTTTYTVPRAASAALPVVTATKNQAGATVAPITQATAVPGTVTIAITAADGVTTRTYTINFTKASVSPPVTASVKATVGATTYNTAAKVAVTVSASGVSPTGTVVVREGAKTLGSGSVAAGKATVTLPRTLAAGSHSLQVIYTPTPGSNIAAPASTTATLQVRKATTKLGTVKVLKGKVGKNAIKRSKKATISVTIKAVGAATPSGSITLMVGKAKIGKASVKKAKGAYVATIKVKSKAVRKSGKIKAVYSGNANLAKRTYSTKIKVKR